MSEVESRAESFRKRLILTAKGKKGARDMKSEQAREALSFLFTDDAVDIQRAAFLTAMRFKGSTVEELQGFTQAMQESATCIRPQVEGLIDSNGPYDGRKKGLHLTCAAAFVAVAAGVPVMMHSSTDLPPKKGIATGHIIEALGLNAYQEPSVVQKQLETLGFGYLHSSKYAHGVEKFRTVRETLCYRSLINTCETLINPAGAKRIILGAAHTHFLERLASAAQALGATHILAVQGVEGSDEIPVKPIQIVEYKDQQMSTFDFDPAAYGFSYHDYAPATTPKENAAIVENVLQGGGADQHLPSVLINAGARIYLGGKCGSIGEGIEIARGMIADGSAARVLSRLRDAV